MFITKLSLPRRTFLRGMGAAVALPLLDSMVPAVTALAQTPARPRLRFGAVYFPNGAVMERWIPTSSGAGFEFSPILKPLEPFRDHLVVVNNLSRAGGEATAGQHAVSAAGWLSGVLAKRTEAEDVSLGTTIDQIIAKQIGQETPFPSLELATEDFTGFIGGCTPGYSCAYMNTISWATPTTPLPMEINPRVVFERLFGRAGTGAQRLARRQRQRSILDSITEDLGDLERGLGAPDRARLDQYLDTIREIERRIQRAEAGHATQVTSIDAPLGIPESFEEHASLMFDLLALAYAADLTRVATFMMAREISNLAYPALGITEPHHTISHHGNNPEKLAAHVKLGTYHTQLFANFVEKLRATPDGDGSLLDHTQLFYGAGMGNGNSHASSPLPLVMVGNKASHVKPGRHVAVAERTSVANLWMTAAAMFECRIERVGESTGRVEL
jgi:hypothetical protein